MVATIPSAQRRSAKAANPSRVSATTSIATSASQARLVSRRSWVAAARTMSPKVTSSQTGNREQVVASVAGVLGLRRDAIRSQERKANLRCAPAAQVKRSADREGGPVRFTRTGGGAARPLQKHTLSASERSEPRSETPAGPAVCLDTADR